MAKVPKDVEEFSTTDTPLALGSYFSCNVLCRAKQKVSAEMLYTHLETYVAVSFKFGSICTTMQIELTLSLTFTLKVLSKSKIVKDPDNVNVLQQTSTY